MTKATMWFSNMSDTNWSVLSQNMSDTNWSVPSQMKARSLNFRIKRKRHCTVCVVKTKALISFAVTAKLICIFVFASAKCWFSHDVTQIMFYRVGKSYVEVDTVTDDNRKAVLLKSDGATLYLTR